MASTGFRFSPTDEELIQILNQKISGNTDMEPLDFIVERNIYELEPQDLQWTQSVALNKNEKYYYCKRESDSREVTGRGWWKATSHVKTICADGGVVGYKRPLSFHRFKDNQRKRKDAIKTDWIMHEYGLQSSPTEWRLCKIKYKGKERLIKEDMENIRNNNVMSSFNPMEIESAFEDQQPWLPPLPVINDYENDFWSNSNMMRIFDDEQPSSSADPSSWIPKHTSSYDIDPIGQHDNLQPFPDDLWS
ncbi:hypothetical protein PTKIN_Ptkin09bG0249700 [Pterospermum kingtungense]